MILLRALPLLAPVLLAACVVPIPVPVPEGTPGAIQIDPGDSCGARDLRSLIGQPASAAQGVRIVGASGAAVPIRVIGPGDAVTEDFNPTRVNLRTDAAGTITGIDCG